MAGYFCGVEAFCCRDPIICAWYVFYPANSLANKCSVHLPSRADRRSGLSCYNRCHSCRVGSQSPPAYTRGPTGSYGSILVNHSKATPASRLMKLYPRVNLVEQITIPDQVQSQNLHPRPSSTNIPPHSNLIPSPNKLKPNQRPSRTWKLRRILRRRNPFRRTRLG